jgi:hypothetical protein
MKHFFSISFQNLNIILVGRFGAPFGAPFFAKFFVKVKNGRKKDNNP